MSTDNWHKMVCVCVCVCVYIYTYIHTYTHIQIYGMKCYLVIKENEILPFAATWSNLENTMLSEENQKEKDKCCMRALVCRIQRYIYKSIYLHTKEKQTHRHRKQAYDYGTGSKRGELGVWD